MSTKLFPALDRYQIDALRHQYAERGYVVLPEFVTRDIADHWESLHRNDVARRVFVNNEYSVTWLEQGVANQASALGGLALSQPLHEFLTRITGLCTIDVARTVMWINRYLPGNHVPIHCDSDGDTQFLLCLQQLVDPSGGGELVIEGTPIPLRTGDAIIFQASHRKHGVDRVGSSMLGPSGYSRVTCVIRYFVPLNN